MIFSMNDCRDSRAKEIKSRACAFAITTAMFGALCLPAHAGTFDGAMGRTAYVVMSGDINGDGQNDVLFKAMPKFVLIPLDDDLSIPIRIAPPSPTFALISTAYGQYTLVVSPDAQTIARTEWKPATQQITYYGAEGAFAASVSIKATSNDQASFVVSMTSTGQLQISSVTAPVTNNTPPPGTTLPSCD
ncbi:MAG: hypothetical protein WKG03_03360 [Telluria sp.]